MSDERARILGLLAEGKITAEEAGRLLDALGVGSPSSADAGSGAGAGATSATLSSTPSQAPRFLYVKVVSSAGDNVNVKVPLGLVRSGLKLTSLIPPAAMDQINREMSKSGVSMDFSALKPDDIEELIQSLGEMTVDVDSQNGDNVRVYCA